jgi:hypothetical protein
MNAASAGVLVVSPDPLGAPTALFFGDQLRLPERQLRVVSLARLDLARLVSGARAVIVVRELFECREVVRSARWLGRPVHYFLDDNFMVLREQHGPHSPFVSGYTLPQVREALSRFASVLLATPGLVEYFKTHQLHSRLLEFPPVAIARSKPADDVTGRLRLAFFGGQHLHGPFLDFVLPALRRLAAQRPVRLHTFGLPAAVAQSPGLEVNALAYAPSYHRALATLAALGVDLLVHPAAAGLVNNVYKNPHALISAHMLGALPVVSNAPPYSGIPLLAGRLLCQDTESSWFETLSRLASDAASRYELRHRLDDYVVSTFSGDGNRRVLAAIGEPSPVNRRPWLTEALTMVNVLDRVQARVMRSWQR